MPEVEIIKKEIIIVDHATIDTAGNLIVTDKVGKEHKVNKNHAAIHSVFEPGMAVEVGYGKYMNTEFIHTAIQAKDILKIEDKKPEIKEGKPTHPIDSKNRAFALSYIKDILVALIQAGIIKEVKPAIYDEILKRAELWAQWLDKKD